MPFRLRCAAWLIEVFVILALVGAGLIVGLSVTGGSLFAGFVLALSALWIYFAGFESSPAQTTLSGRILGTKVTGLRGERLSFTRATTRHFAMYLSGLTPFYVGYLMVLWTKKKQTLHDYLASTIVVKRDG